MGWKKKPDVAQYAHANWDHVVEKVSGTTPEEAMRIAFAKPDVTFFFYCRDGMVLDGPAAPYSPFKPGDAVLFSGEPQYGSAPQCDAYEKTGVSTVYISPDSNQQFKDIGCYVASDGTPAIDAVCLFAANYATNTPPMLRAHNNDPPTQKPFNDNIQDVLSAGLVQELQGKGITVLLTIMNAHTQTGWSQFTDESTAQDFVDYLHTDVIKPYGLDGIDIDDEYSEGVAHATSLPMVTTLMKQTMPDTLITKALWSDQRPFNANWNGHTLGENLDYGWEMSYYSGSAEERLAFYTRHGMNKNQLCLGFSAEDRFSGEWNTIPHRASQTLSQGYAGGMMFDFQNQPESIKLTKEMVEAMNGPDSWTQKSPPC